MENAAVGVRVSAVIPTRNRPDLLCRAVASVLAQTVTDVEAVVVVDGPDQATVSALQEFNDPRMRCIVLQQNVGGSEARNIGIREARGAWIALLDDDDEWLPDKIAAQLELAQELADPYAVIVSQYFEQTDAARLIQPRAVPRPNQPISEYLFCETTLKGIRLTFLQTSSWFASRELFLATPFTKGLKRNQDTDWLLHAFSNPRTSLHIVKRPLVVFYNQSSVSRISNTLDWEYHFQWLVANERLFTAKASAYFLATICAATAAQQGTNLAVFRKILFAALRRRPFSIMCLWLCFANRFVFPRRRALRLSSSHAA
jgi:glycosyltransferase involved in cell wall biosynthesis